MAEMSFFDHLEELRWHIVRSLAASLVGAIVAFIEIHRIYDGIIMAPTRHTFVTYRAFCRLGHFLHLGDKLCLPDVPLEFQSVKLSGQFMQAISSSFIIGMIVAAPYILWEIWSFIKPALKPNELKYTRGIIFWISLLFFSGVSFGYFVIAPYTVNFFGGYQMSKSIHNIITIQSYLSTLSQCILGCGILFQMPMISYFLAKADILSPQFLKRYRRHAFFIILVLASFIAPPDVAGQILVTFPLYLLFELSIIITKRVQKRRQKEEAMEWS